MNTRLLYNYKSADDLMDTRITALETMLDRDGNETLDDRISAAVSAAKSELTTTISGNKTELDGKIAALQSQVDGAVNTWFENGVPTLANAPASAWDTDAKKDVHLGDIYYDTATGYAYRFMATESGGTTTYSWGLIKDSDVTKALADAAEAMEVAEACVPLDMDSDNAGCLLMVGDDGIVCTDLPKGIKMTNAAGNKVYWLEIGTGGAIQVSEVI